MKLTIEHKNNKITVRCDDLVATEPTLREAIASIVNQFKNRIETILK